MRAFWAGLLVVVLALAAFGPSADAAKGKFELYGHIGHSQISMTIKPEGGGEEKLSGPGYTINGGGRYWITDNLGVGLMVEWIQDRSTSAGQTVFDFNSTGFLGTLNYKFVDGERYSLLGLAGVGPYTGKVTNVAGDKWEFPSTVGFTLGLELRSKLTDNASLNAQVGYSTVNFKEAKSGPDKSKLNMNAFTLGVGLAYGF